MADYIEVAEAIERPGLRLVLTAGFPGPWGEAAKNIFQVKGIAYTAVRQYAGVPNPELLAWTGRENAPIAVYERERPRDGWAEILSLAERLAPEPALIPAAAEERVRMFGLSRELCGEGGFAWLRRLEIMSQLLAEQGASPDADAVGPQRLAAKYGYSDEELASGQARLCEILSLLSDQLAAQRARGSAYLVGDGLTALDIYWACFAAMLEPLPDESCPLPGPLRSLYTVSDSEQRAAAGPGLVEHRDFIYRTHLKLPLDY